MISSDQQLEQLKIPLEAILLATNNFSDENLIGRDVNSTVYRGQSEKHGSISVKRLDTSCQGKASNDFFREIALLSEYKHENLVSLVGFCDDGDEQILVYNYESKGSLDNYLQSKDLTWTQRLQICIEAARGLKYLHDDVGAHLTIIHCDIKSANILLDDNWNAKLSDFGFSRIAPAEEQQSHSLDAVGTLGYIDPEYYRTGTLTKESDVYSFGVVLFEILCERTAFAVDEGRYLSVLARYYYEGKKLFKMIPSDLEKQISSASLLTFSNIAYQCLMEDRTKRPTMSEVVNQLEKALDYQLHASRSDVYLVDDLSEALHHRLSIDKDDVTHSNMTIEPSRSMTYRQSVPAFSSQLWIHDVFISFHGEDTCNTFVGHLNSALLQQGIYIYRDDENLSRGDAFGPSLMKAIEESQMSIIVLSENYADSSWCLDELAHIMKCREERGKLVVPIFYQVEPLEVRKQKGKYGEAFAKHELENNKKVKSWRQALTDVCNISGWVTDNIANGDESECIKEIVDAISHKLYSLTSSVNRDLIGIEARVQDLCSKLPNGSGGVLMIGIWGVDGSGKTTLASFIYDRIFNEFNGCCYLENIREQSSKYGLENLQQKILSRVLKQEVEVGRVEVGRRMIKSRLCHRKVLIVLDDVDHLDQLNALAGSHDWFGEGSRIIITTKGNHLLHDHKVNVIYDMRLLNDDESIQLLCKHANWDYRHIKEYELILKDVVSYAGGLPLALRVLGFFVRDNGMNEWGSLLARLKEIPDTNIMEKLRIIFYGPTTMDKKLFPDIPTPSSQLWNYDVYVNFNGEDICKTFVENLCSALLKHGIHIYKDDSTLPRSESVGPSHLKAIQESQIVITVFSKNYADSKWCLEELAHIMNWMDETGQIVMPIFYDVEPSEVQKQEQKYGEAFAKYELENNNKVESWRKALAAAASLYGWDSMQGDESNFIAEIIDIVTHRLSSSTLPSDSIPTSYSQCWNHDIFLSFIGKHGCKTFVDSIYSSLLQQGIHTYKPDETLSHDDLISPTLLKAIEESRIAIIIFSKNYAGSSRCLDELAYIMKCVDTRDQNVMPIFYDVDPSDVQEQNGAFGMAFQEQELENMTKAELWRKALIGACEHSGWSLKHVANMHEGKYIKDIVDTISHTLLSLISIANKDLIGMGPHLKGLKSTLAIESGGVHIVGVSGIAGAGKTTLASSVYMDISHQFEGRCFVGNIRVESREYGLKRLQQKILSTILKKEVVVPNDEEGRSMIKSMLHDRNVLIVLDDVDGLDQLEALAGSPDWFGAGSRIIITSRDQNLLSGKVDVIYGVVLLSRDEAIQLFGKHAYSKYQVIEDYEMLSLDVVSYIGGLPLALKVVGSFLYGINKNEWISFLANLKEIQNPSFTDMLNISYNGLHHEEKELFLDIACFFRHWPKDEALMILDACYLHPRIGVLIRNALISVTEGCFDMHDLVQEMGYEIVRGDNPENPEKHSRVWQENDVPIICASDAMENNEIQALHVPYHDAPPNLLKVVANMKNLRLLSVRQHAKELVEEPLFLSNGLRWISWENYPASSFPTAFEPTTLFGLILKNGLLKELWKGYKDLPRLKLLDLHGSKNLIRTPDFTGLPNLERLVLSCCSSLKKIDPSVGCHKKLVYLNLDGCEKLEMFPPIMTMQNLETLILSRCSQLQKFPEIQQTMDGLQHIYLDYSGIEVVPSSIGQYCINLVSLSLIGCDRLKSIVGNFQLLQRRCLILVDPHVMI